MNPEAHKLKQPQRSTLGSGKLVMLNPPENEETMSPLMSGRALRSRASFQPAYLDNVGPSTTSRVTAFCTATYYRAEYLFQYLDRRSAHVQRYDECIYYRQSATFAAESATYRNRSRAYSVGQLDAIGEHADDLIPLRSAHPTAFKETFYMDYGVVVLWGFDEEEERDILKALSPFEIGKLPVDEVEIEEFHCRYDRERTPKIFNDIIFLSEIDDFNVKLALSLAISQSAKLTLFEHQVDDKILETQDIPEKIAKSGTVNMSRTDCLKLIGSLFNLRTNVVLSSCILDKPELLWTERSLVPVYDAASTYLEISQRVKLLQNRILVISDLLDMLNEYLTKTHGEYLEWIVIWLVFIYCVVAGVTVYLKTDGLVFTQHPEKI